MTETVILPPSGPVRTRRRGVFIPPLLVVALIIFNVLAFTLFGGTESGWERPVLAVPMISGAEWAISWGDIMIVLGLIFLFIEIVKSTQTGRSSVLEHMLSTAVFVIFLVEFLLVRASSNSVFFILMVMSLIDVVAGFTVSITGAGRDVTME